MFEKGDIFRKIYGMLVGHPMNFSFIDDRVAGSARPMSEKEVRWFREKKGINAILSLTEEPLKKEWLEGFDYLEVGIKNHAIPNLDQILNSVEFLFSEIAKGNKIVVHCAAGKGRTGTVLAAYLSRVKKGNPNESIALVREKRGGSIEKKQEGIVISYYENFVNKKVS